MESSGGASVLTQSALRPGKMMQPSSVSPKGKTTPASVRPKGRLNPYACFVQAYRQELRDQDPDGSVDFVSFSRGCAKKWKTMSAEDKERFQLMAKVDGRRYRRQKRCYDPTWVGKKDPRAPKRPLSAFLLFCQEYRPQIRFYNPRMAMIRVAKELGKIWRQLSSWNRKPYEDRAAKLKEDYMQEKSEYDAEKILSMTPANEDEDQESEDKDDEEEENFDDEEEDDQDPMDENIYEDDDEREQDLEDREEDQDDDISSYSTSTEGSEFPEDDWEHED